MKVAVDESYFEGTSNKSLAQRYYLMEVHTNNDKKGSTRFFDKNPVWYIITESCV